MNKFLLVIPLVLIATQANAQPSQATASQGRDACTRDASRFCRAHLDSGDEAVLACLKQNRARLNKACQATLAAHGH